MYKSNFPLFGKAWAGLVLGIFMAVLPTGMAVAASSAIAQSYDTTSKDIAQGALVSLSSKQSSEVVLASPKNASALVGVASSQPLVELSSPGHDTVQVAVGGTVEALVTNTNGAIAVGDRITVSPVSGIGMKATEASQIIGTAQASLDSVKTVTRKFTDTAGNTVEAKVGLIPVAVNVTYYAGSNAQGVLASFVPSFLQSIANNLTGKQVSPLRVLLGTAVLLFSFTAVIIMLYTAVKSGVISLGRNPLAQQALRKGLIDIIAAALGVLIVSGVVVYIILFS